LHVVYAKKFQKNPSECGEHPWLISRGLIQLLLLRTVVFESYSIANSLKMTPVGSVR